MRGGNLADESPDGELRALREEVRQYRAVLDACGIGVFRSDPQGACVEVNTRAADVAGVAPDQARGAGWATHLHPEDRARVLAALNQARESGEPFRSEHRFVHTTGRVVWTLSQIIPDRDAQGRLIGHLGTAIDITAIKEAQQGLQESEQRYQTLAENSAVGISQIDMNGHTVYVNPALRRMLEIDDDSVGWSIYDCLTPESRQRMLTEHLRRAAGQVGVYEVDLVGRRGARHAVVIAGAPLHGRDGVIVGMIATMTDITERKRVESALADNERRLRLITEQIPAVVWTTDTALRFTSSTGLALAALGMLEGQAVGMTVPAFFERDGQHHALSIEAHRRALEGRSSTYEQDWGQRVYHTHVEPLRDADQTIVGVIGIALDITERQRAEQEAIKSRDLLEVRVRQRTEELTQANLALQREVKKRTAIAEELQQSEGRYASILNSQQTLVSRSDVHGRLTYANAAYISAFGSVLLEEMPGMIHPDDRELTKQALESLKHPPFTCTLEQRCEVRGRMRTFQWQVGVIRNRAGQIVEYQGVGFDITERRQAEEMLRAMTREAREAAAREREAAEEARQVAEFNRRLALEVDHRVVNNLTDLLGLVAAMRGARGSRDLDAIESRLLAMVEVHKHLSRTNWERVDLGQLVQSLLPRIEQLCPRRIATHIAGPPAGLSARQAPPVSMILSEWLTNSCKYGAHTSDSGTVEVTWEVASAARGNGDGDGVVSGNGASRRVRLRWRERGGPPPRHPIEPSLGSQLVESFAKLELRGSCLLRFPETGADHLLEFPLTE